jgi:hypothetical protein
VIAIAQVFGFFAGGAGRRGLPEAAGQECLEDEQGEHQQDEQNHIQAPEKVRDINYVAKIYSDNA